MCCFSGNGRISVEVVIKNDVTCTYGLAERSREAAAPNWRWIQLRCGGRWNITGMQSTTDMAESIIVETSLNFDGWHWLFHSVCDQRLIDGCDHSEMGWQSNAMHFCDKSGLNTR